MGTAEAAAPTIPEAAVTFPKSEKVFIRMILGPIGNVTEPQKQLFLVLGPPNYFKRYKTYKFIFAKI